MKALLLLLTLSCSCYARLGETWEECVKRYGTDIQDTISLQILKSNPLIKPSASAIWEYQGYTIVIAWMPPEGSAGASDCVKIYKKNEHLSDGEIETLLAANSNGMSWKWKNNRLGAAWIRDDGAMAKSPNNAFIIFKSPKLVKKEMEDLDIKPIQKNLPNF